MRVRRLAGPVLVGSFLAFGIALVLGTHGRKADASKERRPREEVSASGRTLSEERAVGEAVAEGLRSATDEDAEESESREELRVLYGDYRPYFVRGDFDGDGRLDFAQAFVRRDGPEPLFDVAVFFGLPGGGFAPPVWVERGLSLSTGDLSVDRSVLVVTDDVEQETSRRWRWDPQARRFVDVDEGRRDEDGEPWAGPGTGTGTTA